MTITPPTKTKNPATKTDKLVRLLKARSGQDIATLSARLGWQPHSTRAAVSRLRKAGYAIEKLPPGKQGGTRYRISGAPAGPAQ
jgi:hypothetical protein